MDADADGGAVLRLPIAAGGVRTVYHASSRRGYARTWRMLAWVHMLCVKDIRVTQQALFYYLKPSGLFPTYIRVGETLQGVCHACMRGGAVCYDAILWMLRATRWTLRAIMRRRPRARAAAALTTPPSGRPRHRCAFPSHGRARATSRAALAAPVRRGLHTDIRRP